MLFTDMRKVQIIDDYDEDLEKAVTSLRWVCYPDRYRQRFTVYCLTPFAWKMRCINYISILRMMYETA